jgi:hypothetical protein
MPSLPPLADADEIERRLGRSLSPVEAARIDALLQDASVQVRRYCKRDFFYYAADVRTLKVHDSEITLPGKPVHSVASVIAKGSEGMGLPDVNVQWFRFDGIDKLRLDSGANGIINLPEIWWEFTDLYTTADVTYAHGPTEVPDEVVMVTANAAIGVLTAPTMAAGLIGETIGPYSYRLERGGGGLAVALSQADKDSLSDFRPKQSTSFVQLR